MEKAKVTAYELPDGARIERVSQRDGTYKWAVRFFGDCLNSNGEYEEEFSPSNRTDDFMKRCRFDSAESAYKAWERSLTA